MKRILFSRAFKLYATGMDYDPGLRVRFIFQAGTENEKETDALNKKDGEIAMVYSKKYNYSKDIKSIIKK